MFERTIPIDVHAQIHDRLILLAREKKVRLNAWIRNTLIAQLDLPATDDLGPPLDPSFGMKTSPGKLEVVKIRVSPGTYTKIEERAHAENWSVPTWIRTVFWVQIGCPQVGLPQAYKTGKWAPEEVQQLLAMLAQGYPQQVVAKQLNRPAGNVRVKLYRLRKLHQK